MSKDIFVAVEQRGGTVQKVSIELLGEAQRLAGLLKESVVAVLMGSGVTEQANLLHQYGADRVLVVDHPVLAHYTTEPYAKAYDPCNPGLRPKHCTLWSHQHWTRPGSPSSRTGPHWSDC